MKEILNSRQGVFSKSVTSGPKDLPMLIEWFVNIIDDSLSRDRYAACIKQCYDEIVSNAFEHGNKFDCAKKVDTTLFLGQDSCEIIVIDEGKGFDWRAALQSGTVEAVAPRGRGLYIVKSYADGLIYNNEGNEVKLQFLRRTQG